MFKVGQKWLKAHKGLIKLVTIEDLNFEYCSFNEVNLKFKNDPMYYTYTDGDHTFFGEKLGSRSDLLLLIYDPDWFK